MIYVKRDADGQIIAISKTSDEQFKEALPPDDPDILRFLPPNEAMSLTKDQLSDTDREMIRVIDDLIEILITKNFIQFTELPETAQYKILKRKRFRELLFELVNNDEKIG